MGTFLTIDLTEYSPGEGQEMIHPSFSFISCECSWYEHLAVVNEILVFKDTHFSYNMTSYKKASYFIYYSHLSQIWRARYIFWAYLKMAYPYLSSSLCSRFSRIFLTLHEFASFADFWTHLPYKASLHSHL